MRSPSAIVLSTIALAALPVVFAPAASSAATTPKKVTSCDTYDRFLQQLTVERVPCPAARQVIYAWAKSSRCIPAGEGFIQDRAKTCTVRKFTCKPRKGEGGVRVTCRADADSTRVVRFFDSQG